MSSVARFDTWQAADGTNVARFSGGALQTWDGAAWVAPNIAFDYVLVAGGGGGGGAYGGGGGAGGYRCSVTGELSGGSVTADPKIVLQSGTFPITVGAGGAAPSGSYPNETRAGKGSDTTFITLICEGGGGGGSYSANQSGADGGSGGAGTLDAVAASATIGKGRARQGFDSGIALTYTAAQEHSGGGGGAGQLGGNGSTANGGDGGDGLPSSITGSSVTRAGGGGGSGTSAGGTGGTGGGGNGGTSGAAGTAGATNTGGGGGAGRAAGVAGGTTGGSGVIIFAVPTGTSVSFSGGVTQSSATVGLNTVYTVTATSTTSETVTIG